MGDKIVTHMPKVLLVLDLDLVMTTPRNMAPSASGVARTVADIELWSLLAIRFQTSFPPLGTFQD